MPPGLRSKVAHAYRTAAGDWSFEEILRRGRLPSVVVDRMCGVELVFAGFGFDLWHGSRAPGGEWTTMLIDPTCGVVATSAALGAVDGSLHASYTYMAEYCQAPIDELRYAHRGPEGTWTSETVRTGVTGGALALDGAGVPHLVFASEGTLQLARHGDDGTWTAEVVAAGEAAGEELAIDPDGGVHIIFSDTSCGGPGRLMYARRAPGGAWTIEEVDVSMCDGFVPRYWASMAPHADGSVHVAYAAVDWQGYGDGGSLRYAHRCP